MTYETPCTGSRRIYWLLKTMQAVEEVIEDQLASTGPDCGAEAEAELRLSLETLRNAHDLLKRQDEDLAWLQQDFAELFEFMPDAWVITDGDAVVQDMNHAAETLLGCRADGVRRTPLQTVADVATRPALQERLTSFVEAEQPAEPWRVRMILRDGQALEATISARRCAVAKGRARRVALLIQSSVQVPAR